MEVEETIGDLGRPRGRERRIGRMTATAGEVEGKVGERGGGGMEKGGDGMRVDDGIQLVLGLRRGGGRRCRQLG